MATHTLLVADRSQTVQRIIEMACVGEDVAVVAVGDGEMAIDHITEHPPDIVLADIAMPRRNGYEVAAFVKGRADLAHIPVVLLAGMFEAADDARARDLGCAEVLVKPLKPHHVMERVRHWLESAHRRPVVESGMNVPVASVPVAEVVGRVDATVAEAPTAPVAPEAPLSAEDYFSRLDAAFKSLERPLGARLDGRAAGPATSEGTGGRVEPVPTLQELLDKLPAETRTILTPQASVAAPQTVNGEPSEVDVLATRVLERLFGRDDLLDEIARRVALRQNPAGHR